MNNAQRKAIAQKQNELSAAAGAVQELIDELSEDITEEQGNALFEKHKDSLSNLLGAIEDIKEYYQEVADEEQEKFDNLTEGLQASERGQQYEENASTFSSAADDADMLYDTLEDIKEYSVDVADELSEVMAQVDDLCNVETN